MQNIQNTKLFWDHWKSVGNIQQILSKFEARHYDAVSGTDIQSEAKASCFQTKAAAIKAHPYISEAINHPSQAAASGTEFLFDAFSKWNTIQYSEHWA